MKVFVTGLRGIPGVMGGVETHCEELLPRLARINPDIHIEVCCRAAYVDPALRSFRGVGLAPLYAPDTTSSEALVSTLIGVLHAWRRGAEALHIHAVGPALLAPLAKVLGMRVLLTHHGADYDRAKWGALARRMLVLGEKMGMRFADRIICVSPSLAQRMQQRYPFAAQKTVFIPNGVSPPDPPDRPAAEVLRELQLQPGRFVLCVARLVPEKGLDYLIEAFRRSGDERTLVIAGAGKKGDAFADRLLKEAAPDVRMLGMQTRSTLGVLYRNASLFVLPSFHEGLPIAALEALSCNCPVLLSDIQPNLDLDLPEQCYFPVGDVEELAARLGDHDPTREHPEADIPAILMGWDEVATLTASCYREMVPLQACATRLRNAG